MVFETNVIAKALLGFAMANSFERVRNCYREARSEQKEYLGLAVIENTLVILLACVVFALISIVYFVVYTGCFAVIASISSKNLYFFEVVKEVLLVIF